MRCPNQVRSDKNVPQIEDEIKSYTLTRVGVLVAGIACVKEINKYAPPGYRPDDILPRAKSVIVLGGTQPTRGSWRAPSKLLIETGPAGSTIQARAYGLSYWIEAKFNAEAVLSCGWPSMGGPYGGNVPWQSLKLHAEMAGLGKRSMMGNIILNPKYGFMYYGSVITTIDLRPDRPLEDKVCPDDSCVKMYHRQGTTPCIAACPFGCISGEIENGEIKEARYERYRCAAACMRDRAHGLFIRRAIKKALEGRDAEMKQILYGEEFASAQLMLAFGEQRYFADCWECVKSCPIVQKGVKR